MVLNSGEGMYFCIRIIFWSRCLKYCICSSLCTSYATCSTGTVQSPIDINSSKTVERNFDLEFDYEDAENLPIFNNGHTIEVEFHNHVTVESELEISRIYDLLQFHFHTPSENTLDGHSFDAEVHFVHSDENGNLVVVGVWIDAGGNDECDLLQQLEDYLPEYEGAEHEINIDVSNLVKFGDNFYAFPGSLTTPPCTEGVSWYVKANPIRCTASQVKDISDVIGESNRPTQSKNSRTVSQNFAIDSSDSSNTSNTSDNSSSSGSTIISVSIFAILCVLFAF